MRSAAPNWSLKQIRVFAKEALKTTSCPRAFSFVLARSLENELPESAAWTLMDELDAHGLDCLDLRDPSAEFVLQRIALLKMARGEPTAALPLLERALQAERKREEYRSHYWLARAYEALGRPVDAAAATTRLAARFPLSWYTIAAESRRGRDPLAFFLGNANYPDLYEAGGTPFDRRVGWLHLLMSLPDAGFAVRRYGEYVVKSAGADANPGVLQYLARLFSHTAFYRLQIVVLNQMGSSRPEFLSVESLRLLYPKPFFDELESHASVVDTAMLLGLARQESGFDPKARSRANAQGLLQVLPQTAYGIKKTREKELYDYEHNIEVGAKYLRGLIDRFDGSAERALAAYNAGPTNVRRWEKRYGFVSDPQLFNDLIPFRETRDYVPSILRNAYWYHRLFPSLGRALAHEDSATSALLKSVLASAPQR
jgi:soluble lytic murein transglycosylase